jgi:protein phosphatase
VPSPEKTARSPEPTKDFKTTFLKEAALSPSPLRSSRRSPAALAKAILTALDADDAADDADDVEEPVLRDDAAASHEDWIPAKCPSTLRLEVTSGAATGSAASAPPGTASLTLGRAEGRDVTFFSSEVSSRHAEVRWTPWRDGDGDGGRADEKRGGKHQRGKKRRDAEDDASELAGGDWRLADSGSTNGTFLNGVRVGGAGSGASKRGRTPTWHVLRDGDEIRLGERAGESPTVRVRIAPTPSAVAAAAATVAPLTLRASVRTSRGSNKNSHHNEDRALCECPLRGHSDVGVFAVFDGHAGDVAATRAKKIIPEAIARALGGATPTGAAGAKDALIRAFMETDAVLKCEYEGCTATVMLTWRCPANGKLFAQTANVGDSSCALGKIGAAANARWVTTEHKVSSEAERTRLEKDHGVKLPANARRLHGLALARALGDAFLKREGVGLIATPSVSAPIEIGGGDGGDVAILASDGLWDVCDAVGAVDVASRASAGSGGVALTSKAADELVKHARGKRSRDDCVVLAVRLAW